MNIDVNLLEEYEFAWYGQRALDCVGLDRYMSIQLILCCDYGWDTSMISSTSATKVMSLEEATFVRENWTSAQLDRVINQQSQTLSTFLDQQTSPLYTVAYSASSSLERLAQLHPEKLRLITPNSQLKARLDDRVQFAKTLTDLSLPCIWEKVVRLRDIQFALVRHDIGLPFVIHLPVGSAGSGTFFISSESDLNVMPSYLGNPFVLISKYIDGISLNINAAVLGDKVVSAHPTIQLVGLEGCASRAEVYCGNDYGPVTKLPEEIVAQAKRQVVELGDWLRQLGFAGIFGVDLVVDVDANIVYPVDLNVRFQNSTHLLTQVEMLHGQLPLSVLSIARQLKRIDDGDIAKWERDEVVPKSGAQVIVHSLEPTQALVKGQLMPGIYSADHEDLQRLRDGITLLDGVAESEVVVTCAVPRTGTLVHPGAPLFKVCSWRSVFNWRTRQLDTWIARLCRAMYERLDLEIYSGSSS